MTEEVTIKLSSHEIEEAVTTNITQGRHGGLEDLGRCYLARIFLKFNHVCNISHRSDEIFMFPGWGVSWGLGHCSPWWGMRHSSVSQLPRAWMCVRASRGAQVWGQEQLQGWGPLCLLLCPGLWGGCRRVLMFAVKQGIIFQLLQCSCPVASCWAMG